jgi:hypothetical protein
VHFAFAFCWGPEKDALELVSGFGHFGAPRGALLIMAGLSLDLLIFWVRRLEY